MQRRLASLERQVVTSHPPTSPPSAPAISQWAQSSSAVAMSSQDGHAGDALSSAGSTVSHLFSQSSALTPSPGPFVRVCTPPSDEADAEAEQAAHDLEDLAFGRRQYDTMGRNSSLLPCIGHMPASCISVRTIEADSLFGRFALTDLGCCGGGEQALEPAAAIGPQPGRLTTILVGSEVPRRKHRRFESNRY